MPSPRPIIVWFRRDLRLADNPMLLAAAASGRPVVSCFILDEPSESLGSASRWWLHHSLTALRNDLAERGIRLVLRRASAVDTLEALAQAIDAEAIYATAIPTPESRSLERRVADRLEPAGVRLHLHGGTVLFDHKTLRTRQGTPFRVFTPFWRACLQVGVSGEPCAPPRRLRSHSASIDSDTLDSWGLVPERPNWARDFQPFWLPGEVGAHARLDVFIGERLCDYAEHRDRPDLDGTSRLSPHLHFGELGPRQVWHRVQTEIALHAASARGGEAFLRELAWREFSYYLLLHWPTLPSAPFRPAFEEFPWRNDERALRSWQRGQTGYPIVDAGMRQLWSLGWMHNRVRMIVASFLVKHLLLPWRSGAAWFADTLVDADVANNSASWQWVAGSGADAAPYFRIFNPIVQGKKFDPAGDYVRRWVPELAGLSTKYLHEPWTAPSRDLVDARVRLGNDYPRPIVDHADARQRALRAFDAIRD
jgi:deoxyribodipyrimidine photo-lyase